MSSFPMHVTWTTMNGSTPFSSSSIVNRTAGLCSERRRIHQPVLPSQRSKRYWPWNNYKAFAICLLVPFIHNSQNRCLLGMNQGSVPGIPFNLPVHCTFEAELQLGVASSSIFRSICRLWQFTDVQDWDTDTETQETHLASLLMEFL